MAKRLFVGGLPYSVTDTQLKDMFSQIGPVSTCTVITDKFSGQSKGFGFVEMENDEDADKAIEKLNDTEVGGRRITVNVARPPVERSDRNYPPRQGFNDRGKSFRKDRGGFRRGGRF